LAAAATRRGRWSGAAVAGNRAATSGDPERARQLLAHSDYQHARPLFEQALALARRQGDRKAEAAALRGIGVSRWGEGDYTGAMTIDREALALARARGVVEDECQALNGLGLDAYSLGRPGLEPFVALDPRFTVVTDGMVCRFHLATR
jgi:tetratricopeptide (TPR) repeat protein